MIRVLVVLLLSLGATVSRSPFCVGAEMAQAVPQMPPEGNPDHVEPPKGAYCDRSKKVEHACQCHAACVHDEQGNVTIREDGAHCRAYCFKSHCHCPADCE